MKLLLIEDNPDHAELVVRALGQPCEQAEVVLEESLSGGMAKLKSNETFDAVLLDLSLPDATGADIIHRIEEADADIPIVVLTSLDDTEMASEILKLGGHDYLVKDKLTKAMLTRSLRYAIQRQNARDENRHLLEQLESAQRLLEDKNQRLHNLYQTSQQFLDNVSHEFRTPLTVIKEYGALIRDEIVGPVSEEQDQMLHVIEDRADDLNTMVDDMLDVRRLEAGLMGLFRKSCHLEDILHQIMPALNRKASVKKVELSFDLDDNLPDIFCDGGKIGRVVTNLVINAMKFASRPGKVELSATFDSSVNEICVSVADNGLGIDDEQLDEISQRFKQVGVGARGSCKGFGLGMNIAKEIVDLNYGAMSVVSKPGEGSVFSFTVPVARPVEVVRRYLKSLGVGEDNRSVTLMVASIADTVDESLANDADQFLHRELRSNDLMFRIDTHRWLLVMAVEQIEVHRFTKRLGIAHQDMNRNCPFDAFPEFGFEEIGSWLCKDRGLILSVVDAQLASRTARPPLAVCEDR